MIKVNTFWIYAIRYQILVLSLVFAVSAKPQQYEDYDQEQSRAGRQVAQQQSRSSDREPRDTTTHIPIISQDKQQVKSS